MPPANLQRVDGTGWLPVNLTQVSSGVPLSSLPLDPQNTASNGYYAYITDPAKGTYELSAALQSRKYRPQALADGGNDSSRYETGSNLALGQAINLVLNLSGQDIHIGANTAYAQSGNTGQVSFFSDDTHIAGDPGFFWDNSAKRLGVGLTGPSARLHVQGADVLNSSLALNVSGASGTGLIVTNAGNVGIGTTAPGNLLHVQATATGNFNGLRVSGHGDNNALGTYTAIQIADTDANADVASLVELRSIVDSTTGGDRGAALAIATSRQGTGQTEYMRITSQGNVGIGTTGPLNTFHVSGDARFTNAGTIQSLGKIIIGGTSDIVGIYRSAPNNLVSGANSLNLGSYDNMYFLTGAAVLGSQTVRMTIQQAGNVGIGTTSPTTKLTISAGDAYTSGAGQGLIVKSPDGLTCKRIGIDNAGALIASTVACP